MVFAMHHIKVASLVTHGLDSAWHCRADGADRPASSCSSPPRPPKPASAATCATASAPSRPTGERLRPRQGRLRDLLRGAGRPDPRHRPAPPGRRGLRPGAGGAARRPDLPGAHRPCGTRSACAAPAATAFVWRPGTCPSSRSCPSPSRRSRPSRCWPPRTSCGAASGSASRATPSTAPGPSCRPRPGAGRDRCRPTALRLAEVSNAPPGDAGTHRVGAPPLRGRAGDADTHRLDRLLRRCSTT